MNEEFEHLYKAKQHFFKGNREFMLSALYIIRFVKGYFKKNGRGSSPFVMLAEAGESFISSLLAFLPFEENGKKDDLKNDLKLLKSALQELQRELNSTTGKFKEGSLEFKMWKFLNDVASMINGTNSAGENLENTLSPENGSVKRKIPVE